jgi:putative endonuclease
MTNDERPVTNPKTYCVYILRCSDGTLYTGKANDLDARIQTHNAGKGAKYTRSRLPVDLVYAEEYPSHREAAQRECQLKKLAKAQKEELVARGSGIGNV